MAKSIRSKWKRKMRAIKRVGMDEKVLIRMKKMLAENEKTEREAELEKEKEKAQSSDSVGTDVALEVQTAAAVDETMEVEGGNLKALNDGNKKRKSNLKTMRTEENKYPAWMSTKKIKRHARLLRKKEKKNLKTVRQSRQWKIVNS